MLLDRMFAYERLWAPRIRIFLPQGYDDTLLRLTQPLISNMRDLSTEIKDSNIEPEGKVLPTCRVEK